MVFITGLYLVYLVTPIVPLLVGSLGESWTNTVLATGVGGRWSAERWQDSSFRRAFTVTVEVVVGTSHRPLDGRALRRQQGAP